MSTPLTYSDLKLPSYVNNNIVGVVGGVSLSVTDAIDAAQLAKLNVFLGGKKGSGKTQLLQDMYHNRYGNRGTL